MPDLYIIAGPNGAGKTTASFTILPRMLACTQFVNAHEIARGLSPLDPESVSTHSKSIMQNRIEELLKEQKTFAIETTLATRTYVGLISDAQRKGYRVVLVYLWLRTPEMAVMRVAARAAEGGHNIPPDVIGRRYKRSIQQLIRSFIDIVDEWYIFDNSITPGEKIAVGSLGGNPKIYNARVWHSLQKTAYETGA